MHHLDRGADVDDDGVVWVTAGPDERPEAECRTEPFASGGDEVAQRDERRFEVGVDRAPPRDLRVEEREHPHLGAAAGVGETDRK